MTVVASPHCEPGFHPASRQAFQPSSSGLVPETADGFIFVYSDDKALAHGYIQTGPGDGSGTMAAFVVGGKDSYFLVILAASPR